MVFKKTKKRSRIIQKYNKNNRGRQEGLEKAFVEGSERATVECITKDDKNERIKKQEG